MNLRYCFPKTDTFIQTVLQIDREVYPASLQGSFQSVSARFHANQDSYVCVCDGEELCGYLCLFPISEALHNSMLGTKGYFDDNITPDEIVPFSRNTHLFIISVAIRPAYQDTDVVRVLTEGFHRYLSDKVQRGYEIRTLSCYTVSEGGERWAKRMGLHRHHGLPNGDQFYWAEQDMLGEIMYGT